MHYYLKKQTAKYHLRNMTHVEHHLLKEKFYTTAKKTHCFKKIGEWNMTVFQVTLIFHGTVLHVYVYILHIYSCLLEKERELKYTVCC